MPYKQGWETLVKKCTITLILLYFCTQLSWTAEFETLKIRNLSICKIFKFGLL